MARVVKVSYISGFQARNLKNCHKKCHFDCTTAILCFLHVDELLGSKGRYYDYSTWVHNQFVNVCTADSFTVDLAKHQTELQISPTPSKTKIQ